MKNVRYIFCALTLLVCTTAAATRITDSNQYSATFDGAKKVTFKVMVRCANFDGGGDNNTHSVDLANTFKDGSLSTKDIDKTTHLYCVVYNNGKEELRRDLLYFGTFDRAQNDERANFPQVVSEAGRGWLAVTKPVGDPDAVGVFKVTNAILSKQYETVKWGDASGALWEKKANGFTQHALNLGDAFTENKIMEGEWEMPDCFVGKMVELHMYGAYYDNGNNFMGHTDKKLGSFMVQRDKSDPTLTESFFYPMNENGDPLVGKIGAVYSSMLSDISYRAYYGSQILTGSCAESSGIITVDATDTLTSLKMDIYGTDMMDENVKKTLSTNYVFVKPLHRIYDFYIKPYVTPDGIDRNYNQLFWTIRHANVEDIGPDDMFLIQRATRADFADAENLQAMIYLPISKGTDTTLTFIDSTFSGSLPEGKKLYYRITRGYAAVWEWSQEAFDKNYCVKDSIDNHVLLWSLYDSPNDDITPLEVEIVDGASAMVRVNLITPEENQDAVNYVWDKRAKLLLVRTNLTTGETTEVNLLTRPEAVMSNCIGNSDRRAIWSYKFFDDGLHPCSDYSFSVRIDTTECTVLPQKDALMEYADSLIYSTEDIPLVIKGFDAAKSESKDFVLLSWQNDPSAVDAFFIDYREKGTTDWKFLTQVTGENYYEDYAADPGVTYEYRIYATYTCYGAEKTTASDTASGWLYPYGSISGTVMMPNGTGIKGVTVSMVSDTIEGKVYSYQVTTDMNGHYQYDSLVYIATGTTYMVSVPSTDVNYVSSTTGEGSVNVTLNPHDADKTNYSFQPDKFYSVTGRVLYHNTSVPVAYAEFEMQLGDTLAQPVTMMNASGNPIRSDLNGYFTLQVPTNLRTLRVKKEGHTFVLDGFLVMEGRKDLALTDDLREIRFYDLTKAHVLGRVSAGILESQFTLGTDSSTNRLGDDITLVLELEGDKVSQLVNDPNDLSRTTFDTVIVHQHPWDIPGVGYQFKTVENTTRKRVTIHADNKSGEFRAELLPVRYKIVEMSATGYASLLDPDEAMPVLDLTQSIDTPYEYNYVYHSTPVISYKQTKFGVMVPFYGEDGAILCGIDSTIPVYLVTMPDSSMKRCQTVSEKIEGVNYLLGYPLFAQQSYGMKVGVYEPYYYNNDPQTSPLYSVPLHGELKVYNSMTAEMTTATYMLNKRGETSFNFVCDNVSFTRTGENALRTLNMSFTFNGKAIQSEPLQGYVMGTRDIEGGVMQKLGTNIILDDILRDPYGAGSFATLEKGTTYSTSYHRNKTVDGGLQIGLDIEKKFVAEAAFGIGVAKITKFQVGVVAPIRLSFIGGNEKDDTYTYTYSTSSSISTSSGDTRKDIGAEADVYIGHTDEIGYTKKMTIQVADSLTAALYASDIAKGNAHIITQGRDSTGKPFYLMVTEAIVPTLELGKSQFVFSQYHILTTLIPDLTRKRNDLITRKPDAADSVMVAQQLQTRADETKQLQYVSLVPETDKNFGAEGYYTIIKPVKDVSAADAFPDEVSEYNKLIYKWQDIIKTNEQLKANITRTGGQGETYSLSSGASASHSETSEVQHSYYDYSYFSFSFSLTDGSLSSNDMKNEDKSAENNENKEENKGEEKGNEGEGKDQDKAADKKQAKGNTSKFSTPLADFTLKFNPILNTGTAKTDYVESDTYTRTVSYNLASDVYGSINQTVYSVTNDSWKTLADGDPESWWKDAYKKSDAEKAASPVNDFVFVLNGGATACPWIGPDSAHFLNDKQLGARTLMLDKPTITLDRYEQSDIPADEAAIFTVTLSNESEQLTDKSSPFSLYVTDDYNPNGLSVYMDGLPIGAGRQIYVDPGVTLTKVIEVRRGNGYDFEDVELLIMSDCDVKITDAVRFSVHYVPVASPVTISAPDDKWVLNTLSEQDADGYYLPVTVSGFDIHYDNFDHIEFQYKLSIEGESKWVNLCSYYANDSLYRMATGKRELIKSTGKIEGIHFYGERDPIEQHYDLRAVSFSRYGNGFITRTSPVVSGTKDTRVPDVFGKTSPTSGILTYEDDIRINFTEDIAGQYLDKDNNFQVLGTTNSVSIETGTSLFFPGIATSKALSRATRSLNETNFTIDMMVQAEDDVNKGQLFALYDKVDGTENIVFGFTADPLGVRRLYAWIDGTIYLSEKLPTTLRTFQRLALEYRKDSVDHPVTFRMNTGYLYEDESLRVSVDKISNVSKFGQIALGEMFLGRIMEVRLWNKVLTVDEYGNTQAVRLTGYEHGLLAYWPLDEGGTAQVSNDKAHGNHLDLDGLSWQMPEGCSLFFTEQNVNDPVRLSDKLVTLNSASDYTVMLWWKSDASADTVALFSTGRGLDEYKGLFIGMEHGHIVVLGDGVKLRSASLTDDNEWHHFTLTVNRSQNLVNVYVDEQLVAQSSATGFPGISGTPVLGSCVWSKKDHGGPGDAYPFKGHIDFFSLWKAALPLDFISQYAQHAPSGEEIALQAHLQLHRKYLNPNGIYEIGPSIFNEVCKRDEATGKIAVEANMNKDTLLFCNEDLLATLWDKTVYAPVQESQKMGKLNYQYKAKDDQLLIELTDPEKQINKQQVYISVREVEDLNGNPIASTVTVPVYVDLNRIRWSDYSIERTIDFAEKDTFSATIVNRCGSNKQFFVSTDADWLTCSSSSGQLLPKEERTFSFTVSDGLNPGEYSTIAYVTDETGLAEPLLVNVTVLANEPDWEIDRQDKDLTANLYGKVRIKLSEDNYIFDMDERDIVAAFVENECIGKTHITTDNDGHSDVFMTLYGNGDMANNALITFRLWRATTGTSYTLSTEEVIYFKTDACYGCKSPLILSTGEEDCIQLFSLYKGWNWVSTYLQLSSLSTPANTILKNTVFKAGDEIKDSHTKQSAQFTGSNPQWKISSNSDMILSEKDVYSVKSADGGDIEWRGTRLPDSVRYVTIDGGGACSQLPYLCETTQSVTDALTTYFQYATAGDFVKSYDQFAIFTADRRWVGSLEYMRPGQGYYITSQSAEPVTITYVNNDNRYRAPKRVTSERIEENENVAWKEECRKKYSVNMPMVATARGIELEQGDVLRAVSDGECVGEAVMTNDNIFFVTVYGNDSEELSFELYRNGILTAQSGKQAAFAPHGTLGTYETPFVINFEQVDDQSAIRKEMIDGILYIFRNDKTYNAQGALLQDAQVK